ncbi:Uncharacterized membrane protein YgaE, UPF0421/DUF939 family [Kytococcus aerolatus]|uniref:Uncharacterized membrane protein YgaE, UPF0421/DUF939 family n=1 Tax=Kytococcus aerolatus TaxID=592308 RepID=A0A212T0D8_9MICO|nr:FUSC family protein [Kytococcus aerolatus]SNC59340.1 Uncharacterized membrane protein YgaE, UPF0421/DUF939 family [Kytococcus aerolatus]
MTTGPTPMPPGAGPPGPAGTHPRRTPTGTVVLPPDTQDEAKRLKALERAARRSAEDAQMRWSRLRERFLRLAQAALGAGLSWWVARNVFEHEAPIFAGVVALICLGMTFGSRLTRALEITVGAATGILTGELIVHYLGVGGWQVALIALLAMAIATFAGAGGLLTIQAGVQGVVVATATALPGGALSRWIDALIGGTVAIAIAMLTPTSPLRRPTSVARRLTREVARVFDRTAHGLTERDETIVATALRDARYTDRLMDELRSQVEEGMALARTVPWWWGRRKDMRRMERQLTAYDRLLRNARVMVRRADAALLEGEPVPSDYVELVAEAGDIASELAKVVGTDQSMKPIRAQLGELAQRSNVRAARPSLSAEVIRAQVRSSIVDMFMVTGLSYGEARVRVPARRLDEDDEPQD